jgi:hypothetical protein
MYLSAKAITGHARRVDQHEEVELLLETYIKQTQQLINEVNEMQQSIQVTEEYMQIQLDRSRNQIMRFTLVLTISAFGTSMGGLLILLPPSFVMFPLCPLSPTRPYCCRFRYESDERNRGTSFCILLGRCRHPRRSVINHLRSLSVLQTERHFVELWFWELRTRSIKVTNCCWTRRVNRPYIYRNNIRESSRWNGGHVGRSAENAKQNRNTRVRGPSTSDGDSTCCNVLPAFTVIAVAGMMPM